MMRCPQCDSDNPAGKRFCGDCGAPVALRCPRCGVENAANKKFCGDCGHALAPGSPSVAFTPLTSGEASAVPEGERKTVTALFADLKGSTALMETLDPEEARAIIDPALRIMVEAVSRYDGYVVQSTGDGIFALFGAPIAHEDHPQRALYAALQMQQQLREHGQRRAAGTNALEARVGVNTGEVVVRSVETGGKVEYTPIGHTANLASRLQTLAPIGSIAVSEHTRKLCEGYFELRALGPMAIRGISEAINVYEVTGLGTLRTHFELSARRGLTKFVGRERELEQMAHALNLAIGGHGQVVAVMAEAGTGKSRLFHEFKAKLPASSRLLEAYSVSHGKASAWLPVLELLRKYFGLADADDAAARREKVRCTLDALDPALQDTLPYLFVLLGIVEEPDPLSQMDPQIKRARTLDAIKRIAMRESLKQPLVVIFEDLHWIDEHTQALLDLIAESSGNARILLLVNYRPEYRHQWGNKSHYVQIGLNPLGRDGAEELLTALLQDASELQTFKRLIIERTGGNPFFIEEIVQSLFDDGILVRNGTVKVTRPLSQLRLPPTVQGILAARIDGLSAPQKELLQTLAVIGRESSPGLIRRVANLADAQLERLLADLQAGEFIYEQPAATSVEYVFKHALTQEVAYNSLLIERRKQIHEQAGLALESIFTGQLDDHLGQLAHHYSHSENISKAIEYLGQAGRQALQRSAHFEAISELNAAIAFLQRLPDTPERQHKELPLQMALAATLIATKGWAASEIEQINTRCLELCKQLGDPPETFSVMFGAYAFYLLRADLRIAHQLAEHLLQRARLSNDPTLLLLAYQALGQSSVQQGQLLNAKEYFELALSFYDNALHSPLAIVFGIDLGVAALSYLSETFWYLGYPDKARRRSDEALALASTLSHPHTPAFADFFRGIVSQLLLDPPLAQAAAETAIALSTEHGFTAQLALTTFQRCWAMAKQKEREAGIAEMLEAKIAIRATGSELGWGPHYMNLLAGAYMEAGLLAEGLDTLAEALAFAKEHQDCLNEGETHRLKGELLQRQGGAEIESSFRQAIAIAHEQKSKSYELRAAVSLARFLRDTNRRDEALAMLTNIYGWFTEGFDTADLKDAKTLLTDLGN